MGLSHPVKPLVHRKLKDAEHYISEGEELLSKGRYEMAQERFEQALLMDRSSARAYEGLGESLRSLGRLGEAVRAYEKAYRFEPRRTVLLERKAMTYLAMRKNLDARETLLRVVRMTPRSRQAWHLLGLVDMRMGRYEEALDCFDQALTLQASDKFSLKGKGDVLVELGQYKEALEAYKMALSLDPGMDKVKKALSDLRERLGRARSSRRKAARPLLETDPGPEELGVLEEMEEE